MNHVIAEALRQVERTAREDSERMIAELLAADDGLTVAMFAFDATMAEAEQLMDTARERRVEAVRLLRSAMLDATVVLLALRHRLSGSA